jgi:hypothetical protein
LPPSPSLHPSLPPSFLPSLGDAKDKEMADLLKKAPPKADTNKENDLWIESTPSSYS